jgi:hypothetical protein
MGIRRVRRVGGTRERKRKTQKMRKGGRNEEQAQE